MERPTTVPRPAPPPHMASCAWCSATILVMPSGERLELDGSLHALRCLA